jgi:hypothetical protein
MAQAHGLLHTCSGESVIRRWNCWRCSGVRLAKTEGAPLGGGAPMPPCGPPPPMPPMPGGGPMPAHRPGRHGTHSRHAPPLVDALDPPRTRRTRGSCSRRRKCQVGMLGACRQGIEEATSRARGADRRRPAHAGAAAVVPRWRPLVRHAARGPVVVRTVPRRAHACRSRPCQLHAHTLFHTHMPRDKKQAADLRARSHRYPSCGAAGPCHRGHPCRAAGPCRRGHPCRAAGPCRAAPYPAGRPCLHRGPCQARAPCRRARDPCPLDPCRRLGPCPLVC